MYVQYTVLIKPHDSQEIIFMIDMFGIQCHYSVLAHVAVLAHIHVYEAHCDYPVSFQIQHFYFVCGHLIRQVCLLCGFLFYNCDIAF